MFLNYLMKTSLATITAGLTFLAIAQPAFSVPVVLYDGTQTPTEQQWLYLSTSLSAVVTPTASGTILDTSIDNGIKAGFFKRSPIPLNRTNGYTVNFKVRVNSQSSASNNRSGLSVIVMSNSPVGTQPYGIQLGFWKSSIWAQNVGFTRGEETGYFVTGYPWRSYTLVVQDDQYQLYTNGLPRPILQGPLRQYTGFTPPPGYPNPYTSPNLIFIGDDTTSASSKVTIGPVSVDAN